MAAAVLNSNTMWEERAKAAAGPRWERGGWSRP